MSNREYIEYLNSKHAVVMISGKCMILNEEIDPVFNTPDITFSTISDFRNRYKNRKIKYGKKEVDIGTAWLDSCDRREYEGIVFSPGGDVNGFYNLFEGLAYEPQQGDWDRMQYHIQEIICSGNEEHYNWLLNWCAHIIQNPGNERPGIAIVLRGRRGVGKGVFVNSFGQIFGSHYLHLYNSNQLTGRFNKHLSNCLLCFADEAFWAGDRRSEGVLKGLITEPTFLIEPKNVNAFQVRNHTNLILASNNSWIIPAGLSERRFFVLDVSDDRIQDHNYFGAIVNQMENGGIEAMLFDLLRRQYDFSRLRHAPRTDALLEQITFSMSTLEKFWVDRLNEGIEIDSITVEGMHDEYIRFSREIGERYKLSQSQLGKELRKICPSIERRYRGIRGNRAYEYILPDLDTCRREFQEAIGIQIDEWGNREDNNGNDNSDYGADVDFEDLLSEDE